MLDLTSEYESMTVRGIFYALVSRGVIPKSEAAGYRPVQKHVLKARENGLLPWDFVADSTRWQRKPEPWELNEHALTAMSRYYRRDLWQSQAVRIEVWLEKDAGRYDFAPFIEVLPAAEVDEVRAAGYARGVTFSILKARAARARRRT